MMAIMALVIIAMMMVIFPDDTRMLFTEDAGRIILVFASALISAGYFWIKKIMQVDI